MPCYLLWYEMNIFEDRKPEEEAVSLMTLHASKGLEFSWVFHKKYGEGWVIKEDERMITAAFPAYGEKEFIKGFSDLEE